MHAVSPARFAVDIVGICVIPHGSHRHSRVNDYRSARFRSELPQVTAPAALTASANAAKPSHGSVSHWKKIFTTLTALRRAGGMSPCGLNLVTLETPIAERVNMGRSVIQSLATQMIRPRRRISRGGADVKPLVQVPFGEGAGKLSPRRVWQAGADSHGKS